MGFFESNSRPDDWPANGREERLDYIWDKMDSFEKDPSYRTREVLLAYVNENDNNQFTSYGMIRFTDYEVQMINLLYMRALRDQIDSVRVYLYNIITEATYIQKMNMWVSEAIGEIDFENAYRIKPYEEGLFPPLKLYHFAYQNYIMFNDVPFAKQIIDIVNRSYENCKNQDEYGRLAYAFTNMLNDISYMCGRKKEKIWEFTKEELILLFEMEANLMKASRWNPSIRPNRGVLMQQISNYILKSRNGYNQDYICKYISPNAARESIKNHEIWMRNTKDLNDKREQKVIPELFQNEDWIEFSWARKIDFSPVRTYYVSSFSKAINNSNMKDGYGDCLYGYKNDRIAELISPIQMQTLTKRSEANNDKNPETLRIPALSQVIAFDVIYDRDEAQEELKFLFKVIDLFDMTDEEKHSFLQSILQYWILSVKDSDWEHERERRYVLFLYDEYEYIEMTIEEGFLKEKTSLFFLPDFIMGDNPAKETIKREMERKQRSTMMGEYLHCHNCLVQDYDSVNDGANHGKQCPICGSKDIEIIRLKESED